MTVPDTGERSESGGIVLAANAGPRVPSGVVTRTSVIYLIVNKLLSLSLSLSSPPSPLLHVWGGGGFHLRGGGRRRREEEEEGPPFTSLHLPPPSLRLIDGSEQYRDFCHEQNRDVCQMVPLSSS